MAGIMVRSVAADISVEELQLAARNHGMPLEALRYDVTPVGLHYLLTHYDIPDVDGATWTLVVDGRVRHPLRLSLVELRAWPTTTAIVTMECAGNGRALLAPRPVSQPWLHEAVGTARWTGVALAALLDEAHLLDGTVDVVFTGSDRGVEGGVEQAYARSIPLAEAMSSGAILAYAVNDQPLPPQHGFPLRLVVPGWYGMTNVKWLSRIEARDRAFDGYQQVEGYRMRQAADEDGAPVSRMAPRALMVPPGIPDFMTRRRFVPRQACKLAGRAWSGRSAVVRVEVSVDGGESWADALLGEQPDGFAWRSWSYDWTPLRDGEHVLCVRAHDATGATQPLDASWNLGGYMNNAVQRVPVTVQAD
jgi:DMSO/TMAO reductase YedYZ molybdopterin-dependent catalytic subunit